MTILFGKFSSDKSNLINYILKKVHMRGATPPEPSFCVKHGFILIKLICVTMAGNILLDKERYVVYN